jgi:peptidoglycan/xylan/chitin deacetylase (PgdA/CDA1 family)
MLNIASEHPDETRRRLPMHATVRAAWRIAVFAILLFGTVQISFPVPGKASDAGAAHQLPLLISARQGDTPTSIAKRYLDDPSKGWMISEYNGKTTFSEGEAVLVPRSLFRLGGLTPDGYQTVPVLAYAGIAESPGNRRQVSCSAFEAQLRWLKTEGFTTITPTQLVDFMKFSGQLPERSVLITWDTQSRAFHDLAVPILESLGFTATVFIATERIGKKGAMTWDQLKALRKRGFTIGCRGRRERSLAHWKNGQSFKAYFESIESDLRLAKKEIEDHLGAPCSALAYPRGSTNGLVVATAARIGFSAAFDLSPGDNPFFADPFDIHRIPIDSRKTLAQFGKAIATLITTDLR